MNRRLAVWGFALAGTAQILYLVAFNPIEAVLNILTAGGLFWACKALGSPAGVARPMRSLAYPLAFVMAVRTLNLATAVIAISAWFPGFVLIFSGTVLIVVAAFQARGQDAARAPFKMFRLGAWLCVAGSAWYVLITVFIHPPSIAAAAVATIGWSLVALASKPAPARADPRVYAPTPASTTRK